MLKERFYFWRLQRKQAKKDRLIYYMILGRKKWIHQELSNMRMFSFPGESAEKTYERYYKLYQKAYVWHLVNFYSWTSNCYYIEQNPIKRIEDLYSCLMYLNKLEKEISEGQDCSPFYSMKEHTLRQYQIKEVEDEIKQCRKIINDVMFERY